MFNFIGPPSHSLISGPDLVIVAGIYIFICCIPYRIADRNGAPRPGWVLFITLLLGWTGVVYIAACIYALLAGFFVKPKPTK